MGYSFIERLPIWRERVKVLEFLKRNSRAVIKSPTGTGKSLLLPIFAKTLYPEARIYVVEPRRIAATSLARTVRDQLGEDAGYQIRFEQDPKTQILYLTDGIAIRKLDIINSDDVVILDEFHERRIQYDTILALLLKKNHQRIIVTSATIELDILGFSAFELKVPKMYPVETKEVRVNSLNLDEVVNQIKSHWISARRMLVFLPGIQEISYVEKEIVRSLGVELEPRRVAIAHSTAGSADIEEIIFGDQPALILATNIAETSITPNDLDLVISSGYHRIMEFKDGIEALVTRSVPKSSFSQQGGRVGRTKPGIHVRLTTDNHPEYLTPEILRTNPASILLTLAELGIDWEQLQWIDSPNPELMGRAEKLLRYMNAIESRTQITEIGKFINGIGVDPEIGYLIWNYREDPDKLNVVLLLSSIFVDGDRIFVRPRDKQMEADAAKKSFEIGYSDWLTAINVLYRADRIFKINGYEGLRDWCYENFVRFTAVWDALREFRRLTSKFKLQPNIFVPDKEIVDEIANSTLFPEATRYWRWEYDVRLRWDEDFGASAYIHPSSAAFGYRHEKIKIIKLRQTTKNWMVLVHPIL